MDYRGLALIVPGVALSVFGFQQSAIWGWSNPGTGLVIAAGVVLLVVFYFVELQTQSPLIEMNIFRIRAFLVENLVLGIAMIVFVPVFFFASEYAQISLGKTASQAGLYLLYFFIGFVIASQIGGRILDRRGAKRPVVVGCALAAVGFDLWAGKVTQLDFESQRVVRDHGRGRHGAHAHAGEHRCRQPGLAASPTERPPGSPRRCGTTRRAWVSPFSAPSWCRRLRSRLVTSLVAAGSSRVRAPIAGAQSFSQAQSGSGKVALDPALRAGRLRLCHAQRAPCHGRRSWRRLPSWPSSVSGEGSRKTSAGPEPDTVVGSAG